MWYLFQFKNLIYRMTKYQYQNVCLNMCIQNIKYELFSSFIAFSKLKIALSGIKRLVEVFPDPALSNGCQWKCNRTTIAQQYSLWKCNYFSWQIQMCCFFKNTMTTITNIYFSWSSLVKLCRDWFRCLDGFGKCIGTAIA